MVKRAEKITAVKAAKRHHDEALVMMADATRRLREIVVIATDPKDAERVSLAELSKETGLSISRLSQLKRGKNT